MSRTDSLNRIVSLMKEGWVLKYYTVGIPYVWIEKGDETEGVANYTLQRLWDDGMLNTDGGSPLSTYTLK